VPEPATIVVSTIQRLLERRNEEDVELHPESRLYEDLRLDSLEIAELSAILEEGMGRDPYNEGLAPRTVAEVIAFYDG